VRRADAWRCKIERLEAAIGNSCRPCIGCYSRGTSVACPSGMTSPALLAPSLSRVQTAPPVSTLAGVTWCDWGSPQRVVASLERLGIRPSWLDYLPGPDPTGSGQ
jgi:hypothetical protein